jgi:hypothetical protein
VTSSPIGIPAAIRAGLYLADTSAIVRVHHDPVRAELTRLGKAGLLATCVVVDLEVLYSARDPAEYARTASLRAAGFVDLPPTPEIAHRAPHPGHAGPPQPTPRRRVRRHPHGRDRRTLRRHRIALRYRLRSHRRSCRSANPDGLCPTAPSHSDIPQRHGPETTVVQICCRHEHPHGSHGRALGSVLGRTWGLGALSSCHAGAHNGCAHGVGAAIPQDPRLVRLRVRAGMAEAVDLHAFSPCRQ